MKNKKKVIDIMLHILFWAFVLYEFLYHSVLRPFCIAHPYKEFLSVLCIAAMVYLNYFILLPLLFRKNKQLLFWCLALLSVLGSAFGEGLLVYPDIESLMLPAFSSVEGFREYIQCIFFSIISRNSCFFLFALVLKLYKIKDHAYQLEKEKASIEGKRHQMEIRYHMSKIAPTYLLNTLNSLELIALNGDKDLPAFINRLSQIMDYYLGSSNKECVPLQEEIQFYNNYINLELLRFNEPILVSFISQGLPEDLEVPPLLFEPLIRNAIKYVRNDGKGFVKIEFKFISPDILIFNCKNNRILNSPCDRKEDGEVILRLRNRLDFLFGNNYKLEREMNGEIYRMLLSLKLRPM
jgi:hypothetical protein